MIRLFTSGTHNGLNFSNAEITDIATKTRQMGDERIPFVLGHPKNDLPIIGFIPKTEVILYHEHEKMSIGFDRGQGDFSEKSLDLLRKEGCNKISVRLVDGVIRHIGLVDKAAVAENNQQDFADAMTGVYHTNEDFMENPACRFPNPLNFFKTDKNNKAMDKEKETTQQGADFSEIKAAVETNSKAIEAIAGMLTKQQQEKEKKAIAADFSAGEFSHMSDLQKKEAADFCAGLEADQQEAYKKMLQGLNHKPATPPAGSITAEFGAKGAEECTAEEMIRTQVKAL